VANVLIIDDDLELAEDMAAFISQNGHTVTTLDTTDAAVDRIAADRPDVLVLDVMFPDSPTAGFDLARKIRRSKRIRDLPIILLTGINQDMPPLHFSGEDIDPDWMPVQDFMEKPFDGPQLLRKIAAILAKT